MKFDNAFQLKIKAATFISPLIFSLPERLSWQQARRLSSPEQQPFSPERIFWLERLFSPERRLFSPEQQLFWLERRLSSRVLWQPL
ncbi:MAG: hypothetical protein ACR2GD_10245 [Pyrinomonadaceae bacterium]